MMGMAKVEKCNTGMDSPVSVLEPVAHCGLGKTRNEILTFAHTGHSAADCVTSGASECEERIVPPESYCPLELVKLLPTMLIC